MAGSGAPAAPALLVPMVVEALVLTRRSANALFAWVPPEYGFLPSYGSTDAPPFYRRFPVNARNQPLTGVVLQWALPDGLTHGAEGRDGRVVYPDVPNRWYVTRKAPDAADPRRWAYRSWILASDYVGDPAGSPFPDPRGTGPTSLGRTWRVEDWPGEAVVAARALVPPLTAVGPGDATYAAFAPNVRNVLSLADEMEGVPQGPVSYAVHGWYAAPAVDPLLGTAVCGPDGWRTEAEWRAVVGERRWWPGTDEADLERATEAAAAWAHDHGLDVDPAVPRTRFPARMVCHGVVTGVTWLGVDGPHLTGVPTANPDHAGYVRPQVAVGNSAVDGLATLMAVDLADEIAPHPPVELVEVVEAFAAGLLPVLDLPDGRARLDVASQRGWFSSTPGGTAWTVVAPEDQSDPQGRQAPPPLHADQAALLTALGVLQRALDRCADELASAQWEAYALWWKQQRLPFAVPQDPTWRQLVADARAAAQAATLALVGEYRWLLRQRDGAVVALTAVLGDLRLEALAAPSFSQPNEPVLLVTGAHRAFKHGEDHAFAEGMVLPCRFTGQAVAGIEVDQGDRSYRVTGADVPVPPVAPVSPPAELADLFVEAFFLDTTDAPAIAVAADPADPWPLLGAIRREQAVVWTPALSPALDPQALADAGGLLTQYGLGALPSKVGLQVWSPPWAPLYLDWSVQYVPAVERAGGRLRDWAPPVDRSDPGLDDLTYRWTGNEPPPEADPVPLEGRTFLTPQATDVLAARLAQVIGQYAPDPAAQEHLWALQDALEYVERADLLAQALSGFGLALLQRTPQTARLPWDGSLVPYLRPAGAPSLVPDSIPVPGAAARQFQPVRAGHLSVQRLWVVDDFGQVFDVLGAMGVQPSNFQPVRSPDLVTAGSARLVELKPRLTQPGRAVLPLLDAADDAMELGVDAGTDPVCGWLLLDHLDRSLLVYDALGEPLGELLLAVDGALWLPPPATSPPPHGGRPPVDIGNDHLRAVVRGVLDHPDPRSALADLLALVDEVSWSIDPGGPAADEELAVLVGRPLAVVRAGLRLELRGAPAASQAWAESGRHATGGFEDVRFRVQLGSTELLDDGLVGFWLDDRYDGIESVHAAGDGHRPYVRDTRPELPFRPGHTALLTLLLDPRGSVHAVTGLLPVVEASLPVGFVAPAVRRIAVTFRTGPVLGDATGAVMPLPGLREGTWSWLEYHGTESPAVETVVRGADATAHLLDAPPVAREGWLQLVLGGPSTVLTYAVVPSSVPCTADRDDPSTAILQVSVYNGSGAPVACSAVQLALPVGASPAALTADPAGVVATVAGGAPWTVASDGRGTVTAVPAGTVPAGATVSLLLAGVRVVPEPGVAEIRVTETTDATRTGVLAVAKVAALQPRQP